MKGDFSRLTFDPTKHYSGVRMQQGRVQLDADWNEQMDILMHRMETEVADFIGHSGVPADLNDGKSFQVTIGGDGVQLAPGRIYIAGKLFEHTDGSPVPQEPLPLAPSIQQCIAYLDAWQSTVSALEDPAIREVALGGADTTVRVKNVWRVRFQPGAEAPVTSPGGTLLTTGKLKAQIKATGGALENQLYRVEIHESGGPGQATYKWSRENGSVATTMESSPSSTQIVVSSAGRDSRLGFAGVQWVELLTLEQAQRGEAGALVQVANVEGRTLTLMKELPANIQAPSLTIIVRRWEGMETIRAGAAPMAGNLIDLVFQPNDAFYNQGDYWLIPMRALTGKLEWPSELDGFQPPHGVRHYYAPLALLVSRGLHWRVADNGDLRITFKTQDKGFVSKTGDTMTGPLIIEDNYASVSSENLRMTRGIINIDGTIQQGQGYAVSTGQQQVEGASTRYTKAMEFVEKALTDAIERANTAASQADSVLKDANEKLRIADIAVKNANSKQERGRRLNDPQLIMEGQQEWATAQPKYNLAQQDQETVTTVLNNAKDSVQKALAAQKALKEAGSWPAGNQIETARTSALNAADNAIAARVNDAPIKAKVNDAQTSALAIVGFFDLAIQNKQALINAKEALDRAGQTVGRYVITFNPAFADTPTVVVTPMRKEDDSAFTIAVVGKLSAADVEICCGGIDGQPKDSMFAFTVVGPRK